MRIIAFCLTFLLLEMVLVSCRAAEEDQPNRPPNVVLLFIDDGAFDDYQPFGTPRYSTPNIMTLAEEGRSFYNFYVPQAICSASRAALLSGCYPGRTRVFGAHGPGGRGLEPEFSTLGEVFKAQDYRTAWFGKWHIGDQPDTRPWNRGFDVTAGLMYSNDMWKYHPRNPKKWGQYPLQYWENEEVIIDSVGKEDQKMLTTWNTEKAVSFIKNNAGNPFFLYVAHSMPHVPLFVSEKFAGKSGTGLYGDVIMEIDWSVGEIQRAIKENGLEGNTIFIFIGSDNGPWLSYGNHAGITRFREGKGTTFDGGIKNPMIIKYPGFLDPGSTSLHTFASVDILPTLCAVAGVEMPGNEIDGKDVWDLMQGKPGAENPHQYYPFSNGDQFQAVISADGKWKLHIPHAYRSLSEGGKDGQPGHYAMLRIDTALFDLVHDPYEKGNVYHQYPEVAKELVNFATQHHQRFFAHDENP